MKKKLILLIGVILLLAVGYYFLKKKGTPLASSSPASPSSPASADSETPDRLSTISAMNKYIDKIYKKGVVASTVDSTWDSEFSVHNKQAKDWAVSMYSWCLNETNGWSFEDMREKAESNGYSLPLQMVQSIAWQLYETTGSYDKAVWDVLESKILEIAMSEAK